MAVCCKNYNDGLPSCVWQSCIPAATAVGLHGDMVQERRSEILQEFLEGKHSVLVATNVLGRGIDLFSVRQVRCVWAVFCLSGH